MGGRPEEAGELATLSPPASVPARGSGGSAPLFRPGRGNREGAREEVGWAGGAGVWVAAQLGPGGEVLGRGSSGGKRALFPFFLFFLCLFLFAVFFLFVYLLFCFISFKSI